MNTRNIARGAAIAVIAVIALAACGGKAVEDPDHNYRVTGHFADWGSNYASEFMMTCVSKSDARIKAIKNELKDAVYIYVYEYTPDMSKAAGWNVEYPGANIKLDGVFTVKFIRLNPDPSEQSGWAFDMWMPSTESGGVKNLSPDTLYVPMDRSNEERDAAGDGLGSYNDNPVLLKGAVPYYIVFAVFKDKTRGMGAVIKE
ncbi:MAG: hypothetical protein LBB72_01060 [Spirochaetaceae bacterium]|nr:hypothetical protein [Spirochaetaceae bacterium]